MHQSSTWRGPTSPQRKNEIGTQATKLACLHEENLQSFSQLVSYWRGTGGGCTDQIGPYSKLFLPAGILRRLPFDALVAVDRTLGSKPVGVATSRVSMFIFCSTLRMQTITRMQVYRVVQDLRIKSVINHRATESFLRGECYVTHM